MTTGYLLHSLYTYSALYSMNKVNTSPYAIPRDQSHNHFLSICINSVMYLNIFLCIVLPKKTPHLHINYIFYFYIMANVF